MSLAVKRFVSLSYYHHLFLVGGQIVDLVGNFMSLSVHHSVRGFDESVLIDDSVSGKRTDQSDVRTFRSFYRTHSSVVGLVYITHFKSGSLSGKSSRSQRGKSSLVCQLRQRIVLVHELRKLRTSKELLDGRCHRSDVHQSLRRSHVDVLNGHSLFNYSFHAGKTDPELILKE